MKLSEQINEVLNNQIVHELKNSSIYLQIASFFEDLQLKNIAEYFKKNSQHEYDHAQKFIQHINDRTGGKVIIGEIDAPSLNISNIADVGDIYISIEENTTEAIEEIMDLVIEQKSYIDQQFILDMLAEQIEEEDVANEFATKLKMTKDYVLFDATFEMGE
jgi:ferritin